MSVVSEGRGISGVAVLALLNCVYVLQVYNKMLKNKVYYNMAVLNYVN